MSTRKKSNGAREWATKSVNFSTGSGVKFDACQDDIKKYAGPGVGDFELVREPDNPYDQNAIKVALFDIWNMGYLPTNVARQVAPIMDEGTDLIAVIIKRNEPYNGKGNTGLTVDIVENNTGGHL